MTTASPRAKAVLSGATLVKYMRVCAAPGDKPSAFAPPRVILAEIGAMYSAALLYKGGDRGRSKKHAAAGVFEDAGDLQPAAQTDEKGGRTHGFVAMGNFFRVSDR